MKKSYSVSIGVFCLSRAQKGSCLHGFNLSFSSEGFPNLKLLSHLKQLCILLFILCLNSTDLSAQTATASFNTAGTFTWTCPTGVTTITVQCRGGGGGGGGVSTFSNAASGGGAGGSYSSSTLTVVPGTDYTLAVGAGGAGGAAGANGTAGGTSVFNGTDVLAVGGPGGTGASAVGGTAGGLGTSTGNIGTTIFAGGNGATGASTLTGGGGGGGAGDANPGGNAGTPTAATAGTGGVAGGANGATGVSNGNPPAAAAAPGGGGAGNRRTTANRVGGAGGAGRVVISYTNPPIVPQPFPDQTFCTTVYPTAYNTVDFSINETAVTNFNASQTNQTLIVTLPAGFEFNLAGAPTVVANTALPAQDITIVGFSRTVSAITVTLTTAATQANLDQINFINFQVRATAASSGDLLRTGGTFQINNSTAIPSATQSLGKLATAGPSAYSSSSVAQYTTANVIRGCTSTANPILEIQVNVTGGSCDPKDVVTQFVFNTLGDAGSTNPVTDITKASIYYSDTIQGFNNANFFGSVNNPNGAFTINGSQTLDRGPGPYYFYLTYTIPGTATLGNMVDAAMTSFTFNGAVINSMTTPNPTGGRQIVAGTCPGSEDLPTPTVNTQTITAGSLVIPMDNAHQNLVPPFNLRSYGLVHALLQADIPVKWVIRTGKAKDAADFIVTAGRVYPSVQAAATQTFVASAFVVDSIWLNNSYYSGGQTATQVMTSFATPNNVAVYQLTADVAVDVRYTLSQRPKIAVFSNGGFQAIQTTMLNNAGITNYFVQDAGDFTGLAECYTFCSEAHWDYTDNPDTRPVQRVMDFVNEGGNFLAQCAGIDLYENHQPSGGHFQTTNGINFSNTGTTNTDYNPDMAYCQYQGTVASKTGTIARFWPIPANSVYKAEEFNAVSTPAITNTVVSSAAHLTHPDSVGSNVYYLGGHQYLTTTINEINGARMYLNATLVPARRPTAFPISLPPNPTICAGQSVTIGPVCVSGATYSWSGPNLNSNVVCNPIASPTVSTAYTVIGFNGGCIMGPSTMTVNVNPTPVMTSTNSATICGNGTVNIPLTSSLASTYTWIAANNPNVTGESVTTQTTSTLNNTLVNTTTVTQTVIYTVTPTSTLGSCVGTPQTVSVTVNPAPTMTSANTATICAGATVNITLTANMASPTFTWIASDNVNTTGESLTTQSTATLSNTITNSTTAAENVIYTVTPTAGGCPGTAQTVTVTVNPTPSMTSANTATICSGATVSIPLTSNIASTYTWIAADNVNTTGESLTTQSTATLSNTITNSSTGVQDVIYTVTPSAGGCAGTAQTVTVSVNASPTMTSANTATICTGATVSIPLTANVGGTTFNWIAADNVNTSGESLTTQNTATLSNTITNGTTSAQNVVYTVTPFSGSCSGTVQTVTVTVNPTPAMTSANTATICSGATVSIPLTANVSSNFTWIASDNVNTSGESLTTQNTATLSNTISNSSTSVQSVIYTVTPTSSGGSCAGTAQTVTVTVNPTPAMTSANTATICSGAAVNIALTANVASNFTWIAANNANTTGESTALQSTSTINDAITNSTAAVQTVIYTVTPTSTAGSCAGAAQTVSVTVNPTPAMTSASTATICSGATVSIPLTSNVASTYTWIASDNVNTAGESLTTQSTATLSNTITNSSTSSQAVVYTVTPTSTGGSCVGASQTVTVTVNPTPVMTSASTATICGGSTVSIPLTSNIAATYTWIASDNVNTTGESLTTQSTATLSNTITNGTTSAQNVIYTVTPTAGTCAGTSQTVTVTVNPAPTMTSANTATICTGNVVSIPLTANVGGSTFTWIAGDNVNTSGESLTTQNTATLSNTITNGTAVAQNVIYTVTPAFGGCNGTVQTVTVTVNPVPAMTSASTTTICSGGTATINLTANVPSNFTWIAGDNVNTAGESLTTQNTATLSNTITNSSTSVQNVIYTVTPTSTGGSCAGTAQTVTVTVNPTPAMTSANTATICSGSSVNITLTSNVASTYTWIAANNASTTGESLTTQSTGTLSNTITNSSAVAQNVIYTVTPTSSGGSCVGASQTVTVTVNPAPVMTSATSATICTGGTATIPLTSNIGATYTWIAGDNPNTTGESLTTQNTATLSNTITNTLTTAQNVIYTVTPTSTGGSCPGAAQTVTVQVNPVPTATATPSSQTICSGSVTTVTLTSNIAGTVYNWTVTQSGVTGASASSGSTISQTLTTTGAAAGTAIYTITPVNGCSGAAITVTVTVNPTPSATATPNAQSICSGNASSIALTSNVGGATFNWTVTQSGVSGASASSGSTIAQTLSTTGVVAGTATYTITPTAGGCAGAPITATVTVNPVPSVTATPATQSICSTNATSVALTSNVGGTTFAWTVTQTGVSGASASSGSAITQTLSTTGVSSGTAVYTITPTAGTCAGAPITVTVTVNPVPSATATPNTQTFCSGNTTAINLTSNVGGATFAWTVTQTGVSGASASSGSTIAQTISTTGAATGTAVYTITPTAGTCVGSPVTATVTVNPLPVMTSASTATICSGGTVNIPLTSNVASTYTWIAANNPNTTGESVTTQTTSTLNNTLTSTTGTTEVVVYTVTPTSSGGSCAGSSQTVSVTISPTPIVTVTPTSQAFCSGGATSITLTSNVGGTVFNWTVTQTGVSGASASSGSSITQTLSTTGAVSGTAVYTITPTIGTCTGTSATATVTVNPVPTITATPNAQSICSGNATAIALTSNVGGATFAWTVTQTGVSGASASSGSNITQTLTATGTTQGTATYTITPTAGTCSGAPIVVTVSVNPIPSVTATPSVDAFCTGGVTSVALTSNVTGTTFAWTVTQTGVSGASASSGSSITQTLTTTGAVSGAAVYTITPTAGACVGSPTTVTVTVHPIPAMPSASSNSPVCLTNTINLSTALVSGATYNWSGPNTFTSNAQNPNIPNAAFADAGTYSLNITVNGCTSPTNTVVVVVNTPPPTNLSPGSNSPVCTNQTLNLTIGAITNASYSWSGPNSFTSTAQNPSIANIQLTGAGIYTVVATVPGCGASGSGTVSVVVNPTPAPPSALNNGPLCEGDNLNLTANGTGTSYSWSGPATYTSNVQNPTISGVSAANAGVYSVTTTDNGCTSAAGTTTVVINTIPTTPVPTSNSPLCINQTLNLNTGAVSGATYSWTGPNTFTANTQNTSIPNATGVNAGTYSLTITVNGCTSATGTVAVIVNAAPATPTASANSPACVGDTLFLSATTGGGATYSWTGPNSFTSTAQNPVITPVTMAEAGTYTVIANNGCASTPVTVSVTVNPQPSPPTPGSNTPLCQGGTLNLTASPIGSATYSWTGPNSFTANVANPSVTNVGPADAGTYSVTVTVNGCVSTFTTTVVAVNTPAVANAGSNQTVCANNLSVALSGTVTGGSSTGNWTSTGTGTFTPGSTALNATYTPSNADTASGSIVLTLSSTNNGGCTASTSAITVTITDAPGTNAGPDQSVCANNSTVTLNGSITGGATGGTWTTSGTGTFTPNANTLNATYDPSPADTTAGVVTFTLTSTGNGQCLATSDQITVTISNAPSVNAGPDQVKCKSSIATSLSGTVTVTGTGTWSTLGTGTFTPNANTLNATYNPGTADTTAGSVILVLTSTGAAGCAPATDTVRITFTDIPSVNAGSSQTVCANNANVALNGTVTVGSTTGAWSTSGTGTFTPSNTTLNGTYIPSSADTAAGSVTLTLSSTGGCVVVTDNITITFTDAPGANAGPNVSVCANNAVATFTGTVSGATSTGIWSTAGTGTFSPGNTSLPVTYTASAADVSGGSLFIILTSTGNGSCNAAVDTMLLTFTAPPTAFAGNDTSFCANSSLALNGVITGGGGTGTWTTSGSGTFTPNGNTLNATYSPSSADTAAGSVTLTLSSTNNGGCLAATDQVVVTITDGPTIFAGADQAVCANNNVVTLNGSVSVSSGVTWSTAGDGTFGSAGSTSTTYTPGANDISSGGATIVITSTGNGGCNAVTDTMQIQIQAAPVVNAGANQFICSGVTNVSISGTVTVSGTGTWTTLGSGTFGSAGSLSTTYSLSPADTLAGTVTLVLTSTNNGACAAASDTVVLAITPAGFASAGVDTTVCANVASVTLAGIITGGNGTGVWTTSGTGTFTPSGSALNASYVPGAADISGGSVVLTLTPNSCMPSVDSMQITFAPEPVVNAGTDQFICATNNTVTLNGSVSGGSSTGTWTTLGSGSFTPNATTLNATYTLSQADSTAGSVSLVLTSTFNGSCGAVSDTVEITLTLSALAQAGNDTTLCAGATALNLGGIISGGTGAGVWSTSGTGTFSPNDSTLNASYSPSSADVSAGSVVLTLTPINACQPTADSLVLTLVPTATVNAGTDIFVCTTTNTVTLNGSVTGATTTGTWTTLGSGTFAPNADSLDAVYTLSTADSTAGTVTLVLTSTNNGVCGAVSDTVVINTTNSTTALAGSDTTICSNDSLGLAGIIVGGSTGQWTSNGSGTFSPSASTLNAYYLPSAGDITAGNVVLTLTPTSGCQPTADSLVLSFDLAAVVSAGSNSVICASTNTVALNGSVSGGSTTGNWTSSGSGTFLPNSTTLNATYQLSQADSTAGSVTLLLTSTLSGSCGPVKDSITITITTPASALAGTDFTVCANNASITLGGTITGGSGQGQWTSSGNGTFTPADTILNATYTPGGTDISNGTVVLTLTPQNSCAPVADSLVVTITPAPTVNAGNDSTVCGGLSVINLNGSTNAVSTGAVWTSNGTGTFSPNDSTLNASYTPAGTDNDTLIFVLTSTGNGLCNAVTDTIRFIRNVSPSADFAFSNFCSGQAINFADSTTGPVVSWSWNFGNGDTSTTQNPAYTYTASGTYTVSLSVSGGLGCNDSITKTVTVQPAPLASFTLTNACLNDSVNFVDASSVTPGSIVSWNWGFGDGNTSTQQNPVHQYDSVKVYTVSLSVTSDSGCTASLTQTISINPSPQAGFTTQYSCGSLLVNFTDTTFASPDSATVWSWNFGDGNTSTQQNPSNTYTGAGTYTVILQAQTSNGCADNDTAVLTLGAAVVADYIPAGGSYNVNQGINFTNQSTGAVNYSWNFGDNTAASTVTDPSHAFTQPGTYTVVLIADNGTTCSDTVDYVFTINSGGYTVPTGFSPNGDGRNDFFYIMGGPFSQYDLHVFNEWGNEIFMSSSQADKWDGSYKDHVQPAGTYIYLFTGKTFDGQVIKLKGEINIIR